MNCSDVRSKLITEFKEYMLGPHWGNDEIIDTKPEFTYMVGILYPQDSPVEQENASNEINDGPEQEVSDKSIMNSLNPSSFGLTCMLEQSTENIKVKAEYGVYTREKNTEGKKNLYQRHHHDETFTIPVGNDFEENLEISFGKIKTTFRKTRNGVLCTVYLINTHEVPDASKSQNIIFQPRIEIISEDNLIIHNIGNDFSGLKGLDDDLFDLIFEGKQNFGTGHGCAVSWNDEEATRKTIGRIWTDFIPEYEQNKIEHVDGEEILDSCVDMKKLSQVDDHTKYSDMLSILPKEYSKWIRSELEERIGQIDNKVTGENQIEKCHEASKRIQEGIEIVSSDPVAGKAFRFMNQVMMIQITCTDTSKKNISENNFEPPQIENASGKWRLFQIGFILMNVKSFLAEKNEAKNQEGKKIEEEDIRDSREVADLLWFPTGGGKTEAYLGIIAFAIAMRRLSAEKNGGYPNIQAYGVSVLMRYTLRLLTVQQFQRAATLMCACEYVRRQDPEIWGSMQFMIGLWVGMSATPNALKMQNYNDSSAEYAILNSRKTGKVPDKSNPMQLLKCPWCGSDLDASCYEVKEDKDFKLPERLRVYCKNKKCFFHKNNRTDSGKEVCIPILTVDEDIYRWCPSVIISTVDKFAQIAWNENIASLFGRFNKFCNKHGFLDNSKSGDHKKTQGDEDHSYFTIEKLLPPDLIVQDELHLISGPLGTLTSLYETAIDYFCKNKKREMRPKIIASTATTKSASSQIETLFNRKDTAVFPPQGFEFGKTFFSDINTEVSGKIFLAISPTARSQLTILAMSAASFMRRVRNLKDEGTDPKILDPYYTLVSYFNSKRELGGAYGTFSDTVPDYFNQIFNNVENRKSYTLAQIEGLSKEEEPTAEEESTAETTERKDRPKWKILNFAELTSRKSSGEIPDILKDLSTPMPNALDYLLCTNMLSVGVDVQRLSLMIVNGQPKNHSEYIQATGRVGRNRPGLILTIYNSLKPRDLSHFENFRLYHSAFFKYVEPISITPFASRSRDKGLFAVCVGMLRNMVPLIAKDPSKFELGIEDIRNAVSEVKEEFNKRIDETDRGQLEDTLHEIDDYLEAWAKHAKHDGGTLKYRSTSYTKKKEREATNYLLTTVESGNKSLKGIKKSPMSLRDAEQMHDVYFYESLHDFDSEDEDEDEE